MLYQLSYTRIMLWGEKDSNLRRRTPADLQSAAIDRSAISPNRLFTLLISVSHRRDSNPRPTDYKSVALPTELRWQVGFIFSNHSIQPHLAVDNQRIIKNRKPGNAKPPKLIIKINNLQ